MKKGFTLIELLVVITIISILAVIALVSYNSFIKAARDARRESDLKFIQSALEQYHADQKYYPPQLGSSLTFGSKTYLTVTPSDPKGSPHYSYVPSGTNCPVIPGNCTSYCLFAKLETSTTTQTQGTCNVPVPEYNFGVTKP